MFDTLSKVGEIGRIAAVGRLSSNTTEVADLESLVVIQIGEPKMLRACCICRKTINYFTHVVVSVKIFLKRVLLAKEHSKHTFITS